MDRLSDNEKMPDVPDSTITRGQARELQDTKCVPCVRTVTDAGRCATHGYSYFPKSEEQCDAARPSRSIAQTANDAVATLRDLSKVHGYGTISPEDMNKLRLMGDMLFNRENNDRCVYAKKIGESITESKARQMAATLLFVGCELGF